MTKTVVFSVFGGPDVLQIVDIPTPAPGPGEVRVEVKAAGVQPFDAHYRAGISATSSRPRFLRLSATSSPASSIRSAPA